MANTTTTGFYRTPDDTIYFVAPNGDVYYVQGPDDDGTPILYRVRLPEDANPIDLDPDLASEYCEALLAADVPIEEA